MANYIKIDRKIFDWEWYKNLNTCRLFFHILLKANWKNSKFEGKDIPRGSFVGSVKSLSLETSLTTSEVRTALKHLELTNEIAIKTYSKYSVFTVNNYNKYQDIDKQNDKQLANKSQTISKQLATIEEKKEYKEGNKDNIYQQIADLYNDICVSFPQVTKLSEKRQKAIKARLNMYSIDDFKQLFQMAEQSNFLKGCNDRNWSATFDWLIADSNMAKVLDGNYKNKADAKKKAKQSFDQRTYDYDELERQLIANRNNMARKRKEQN